MAGFGQKVLPSLSTLSPGVITQLGHRKTLFEKKDSNLLFQANYLNNNSAFLKVTSGILVDGSEKTADENILLGGTLNKDKNLRKGIDLSTSFLEGSQGAYSKENTGIVPMPGIINFQVKNRGNSGFSREASFTIKCWSRDQLNVMETLYMRPGFKILVEWGHTLYKDKNGDPVTAPITIDKWTGSSIKEEDVIKKGNELIENSGHNYDYLIGLIKNYSWEYADGGYEINVEVLGRGAASTFIKQMYTGTSSHDKSNEEKDAGFEFSAGDTNLNGFAKILKAVANVTEKNKTPNEDVKARKVDQGRLDDGLSKRGVKGLVDKIVEEIGDGYTFEAYRLDFKVSKEGQKFVYLPIRFLLGMINHFFLPRLDGNDYPEGKFNTSKGEDLYLTFDEHFSIDPAVCMLPQQKDTYGIDGADIPGDRDNGENTGDIMDIMFNVDYAFRLYETIDSNAKTDNDSSIGEYLSSLFDAIQSSLGGVNQFQLFNDFYLENEKGPSRVVDRQLVPNPQGSKDKYEMIVPIGESSFVRSFRVNSELSRGMLNLIVNQAILKGQDASKSTATGLASFNANVSSRVDPGEKGTPNDASKAYEDSKAAFIAAYEKIKGSSTFSKKDLDKIIANGKDVIKTELNTALEGKGDKAAKRGFIGANLDLGMLGISGIKALEFFTIPKEILPAAYSTNVRVGFQISNVSHSIENNQWYTDIDARAVILNNK